MSRTHASWDLGGIDTAFVALFGINNARKTASTLCKLKNIPVNHINDDAPECSECARKLREANIPRIIVMIEER